jgi:hypothetical protein
MFLLAAVVMCLGRPYSLVSAPLYGKQQHHHTGRKQNETDKVKLVVQILDNFHGFGLDDFAIRDATVDQEASDDSARRKVDVEAPSPAVIDDQYFS